MALSPTLQRSPDEIKARFASVGDVGDIADLLEITPANLVYILYRSDIREDYRVFEIPKRSGGFRTISVPHSTLKILQSKLKSVFDLVYLPRGPAKGFIKGRSIVQNAELHKAKRFVLNVDLEEFFPSINFGRVRGLFMAQPYNLAPGPATVLAQIICHNNQLPQGAPTSPILSNMICTKLDGDLLKLAVSLRCTYTRYADDITFSTTRPTFPSQLARHSGGWVRDAISLGQPLLEIVRDNGFSINPVKSRLQFRDCHQEVTGLTVNSRPNVNRKFIRQLRAMIHSWETQGLVKAGEIHATGGRHARLGDERMVQSFPRIVRGKLEFLKMVRGEDDLVYRNLRNRLSRFAPEIITELAALRSCFISYGEPDTAFADRLKQDLEEIGVRCWHYPSDSSKNERTWKEIAQERRQADRVLAICSVEALIRDGVVRELEAQLDEEPDKLILVSLDKVWTEPGFRVMRGNNDLKPFLMERNRVDCAGLEYQEQLTEIVRALRPDLLPEQGLKS